MKVHEAYHSSPQKRQSSVASDFKIIYHGDVAAGSDGIAHAHHTHLVGILSPPHEVLVTHEVWTVVDHEAAALHPAGLAAAEVGGHVRTVSHALIRAPLEVLVLVEDDLKKIILVNTGMNTLNCTSMKSY